MPREAKASANVKKGTIKKKNGYAMPESIPLGEIVTDSANKRWKVGPSIGKGGFGEIYSACDADKPTKNVAEYEYVVKIEPHANGPLFVEMHFYIRNAKQDDIKTFMKEKKLKNIGMPYLVGNGSHELNNQKHRFIVMPRYGKDIWHHFLDNGRKLPEHTNYRLALQMLDVYEYIHNSTYVHGDLKGSNILLGLGKTGAQQAYLVDFGLASHYTTKDFKPDVKKMHNGTIEYTSRDAHLGVNTMRGDFEILGYNLINWSGVLLPWEAQKILSNPSQVQKSKEEFMKDTDNSLKKLYNNNIPAAIKQFFSYITSLKYDTKPDYEKCRKMFRDGLKSLNKLDSGDLQVKFSSSPQSKKPVTLKSKSPKRAAAVDSPTSIQDESENEIISASPKLPQKRTPIRKLVANKSPVKRKPSPYTSPTTVDRNSPQKRNRESPRASTSKKAKDDSTPKSFTPVVNINKNIYTSSSSSSSTKKPGKTIINDNLTPNSKTKKTYQFDFELDVSMDANVIVNIKRKKKAKKDDDTSNDSPRPKVRVKRLSASPSTPKEKRRK